MFSQSCFPPQSSDWLFFPTLSLSGGSSCTFTNLCWLQYRASACFCFDLEVTNIDDPPIDAFYPKIGSQLFFTLVTGIYVHPACQIFWGFWYIIHHVSYALLLLVWFLFNWKFRAVSLYSHVHLPWKIWAKHFHRYHLHHHHHWHHHQHHHHHLLYVSPPWRIWGKCWSSRALRWETVKCRNSLSPLEGRKIRMKSNRALGGAGGGEGGGGGGPRLLHGRWPVQGRSIHQTFM